MAGKNTKDEALLAVYEACKEPRTRTEIAGLLNIDIGAISRIMPVMISLGYIESGHRAYGQGAKNKTTTKALVKGWQEKIRREIKRRRNNDSAIYASTEETTTGVKISHPEAWRMVVSEHHGGKIKRKHEIRVNNSTLNRV